MISEMLSRRSGRTRVVALGRFRELGILIFRRQLSLFDLAGLKSP